MCLFLPFGQWILAVVRKNAWKVASDSMALSVNWSGWDPNPNQRQVLNDFIWFYSTLFIFIALFVVCVVRCSFNRLSICNTRRRLSSLWMTLFVALCGPFESICEKKGFDPPLLVPTECIFWLALDTRGPFNTVIKNSVTHYLQV